MAIKLERILNISAEEYVKGRGIRLEDYKLVGIHYFPNSKENFSLKEAAEFADLVPDEAEVVVDYKPTIKRSLRKITGYVSGYTGTALVPKKTASEQQKDELMEFLTKYHRKAEKLFEECKHGLQELGKGKLGKGIKSVVAECKRLQKRYGPPK